MLKIIQARIQQYVNWEFQDVLIQAGFWRDRTRHQIASIRWIMEKAKEFQRNICFIDYAKVFDCMDHNKLWKLLKEISLRSTRLPYLSPEKPVRRSRSNS